MKGDCGEEMGMVLGTAECHGSMAQAVAQNQPHVTPGW